MSTDQDIINECIKGSRAAQALLYNKYASKLLYLSWRYVKVKDDAEDVLQEAFIKIFKSLDKFKQDSSLETWMRRIVINTALNHQRSKLYMYPMIDISDIEESEEPTALEYMNANEIMELVNKLPDGCRIVFNLYAIEGYKHKEIAELLSINEGTSKSQLARAKKILKESIEELDAHRAYHKR